MTEPTGPDKFNSPTQREDSPSSHKRRISVAGSLIGSIRRKAGIAPPVSQAKEVSPERPAEIVPLPSSPIDIPTFAPALELDLGPSGLMSPTFGRSPEKQRTQDTLKMTDPANIASARPQSYHVGVHDELLAISSHSISDKPATPRELLCFPTANLSPPSAPATPMSGTNQILELDGANSDKLQVFERSVTPSNEKERKELRTMRSLDAMAEACTVAHNNDEAAQVPELTELTNAQSTAGSPEAAASPWLEVHTPRRDARSASTVHSVPSDMPELTRQKPAQQHTLSEDQECITIEDRILENPFADEHAFSSGPPSPIRSVKLPFRPKITVAVAEPGDDFISKGKLTEDKEVGATDEGDAVTPGLSIIPSLVLESQLGLQRDRTDFEGLALVRSTTAASGPSKETGVSENQGLEDDTHIRFQELLKLDVIVLHEDDDVDSCADEDGSAHAGPLVPQLFHRISNSKSPSPCSLRSRTTYTAGLGDAEYKFTFDKWQQSLSDARAPDEEPTTPNRRSMDMSLDSVSSPDERKTPQISPTSTNPNRTPSMGIRLEFDFKRSDRNMRYNALHQDEWVENRDRFLASARARKAQRFIIGGSEETDANVLQLANFENAYAGARGGTPQRSQEHLKSRWGSNDSVADSLKDVASNNRTLEAHLSELPIEETQAAANPFDETPFHMSSSPGEPGSAELSWYEKLLRSGSPLPEKEPTEDEQASSPYGALDSNKFSLTTRGIESPNRFQGLPVMESMQSPEHQHTESGQPASPRQDSKDRFRSSDTLDEVLPLFSSPESGYQADKSSVSPESAMAPQRARSRYRKKLLPKPLSDLARNF